MQLGLSPKTHGQSTHTLVIDALLLASTGAANDLQLLRMDDPAPALSRPTAMQNRAMHMPDVHADHGCVCTVHVSHAKVQWPL